MSETGFVILWVFLFAAVYVLTRKINAWRAGKVCMKIIEELESKGAYDPEAAVVLKGGKRNVLKPGVRNFRPEALRILLLNDVLDVTQDDRYYLTGKLSNPASTFQHLNSK